MTDLERRALMGDAEAQRQCTEKGIVLACVYGVECAIFHADIEGHDAYRVISKR